MEEPLAELAGYFRRRSQVPDAELIRLAAAARAGGSGWDAIAAGCGVRDHHDIAGVVGLPCWEASDTGAELLFSAAQYAMHKLTGSRGLFHPMHWDCPGCGQQVADRAPAGRPVYIEHGHKPDCVRLADDQATEDQHRRDRLPGLLVHSEDPVGAMQRHWLAEPITDDCPRCGWYGYFHHFIATVDGDWSAAVCDNCYADLHPDITVTVKYFKARSPIDGKPVAAIRQRTRSDHDYPDLGHFPDRGQMLTWRLSWIFTPMLVEDRRGSCDFDIIEISCREAGQIAAGLAAEHWPPDAARLPWVASAYPEP